MILANGLKSTLNKLIHNDEKAFVNGRFIGENIRIPLDIVDKCRNLGITGLIMLIDNEKAFDSLEWDFILKSLSIYKK